jgi:hypothetical protein
MVQWACSTGAGDIFIFFLGGGRLIYGPKYRPEFLPWPCADWLSIWCVDFFVDFGHVRIPKNLNVPPSLRMLGVEPQSKLNCEVCLTNPSTNVRGFSSFILKKPAYLLKFIDLFSRCFLFDR